MLRHHRSAQRQRTRFCANQFGHRDPAGVFARHGDRTDGHRARLVAATASGNEGGFAENRDVDQRDVGLPPGRAVREPFR